jgi:hypothetical protein
MTTFQLSKALSIVFNNLANDWIKEHLDQEPFLFRTLVRKPGHDEEELGDYIVEVYTDRFIPRTMTYTKDGKKKKITPEFLRKKLISLSKYIEPTKSIEIKLMDIDYK